MAVTVTVVGAGDATATSAPARTSITKGAAYLQVDENVGFDIANTQQGHLQVDENVGFDTTATQQGHLQVDENVGFDTTPEAGGYLQADYGDVDDSVPTPHVWYLLPTQGRGGQGFLVVGQGFGTNPAQYGGTVVWARGLPDEQLLNVVNWVQVAASPNAYAAARAIDPQDEEATDPEHQTVTVTVPPDAVPPGRTVLVEHDA